MVYVGSAEDTNRDQVLEEVMVGPVSVGINRFILQSPAPNPAMIANEDLIGVTVILVTCSYMDNKFVQIGYYVNNEYAIPFEPENYPNPVEIRHLFRNILADQPRVTRYPIDWSGNNSLAVFEPTEEEKARAMSSSNDEVIDMDVEMEEDDEDDDDEDEEGNENDEVDLEDDEEEDDEDDEEGEEEEEGVVEMGAPEYEEYVTEGNFIYQDDSNSIDIDRMLQR